MTDPLARLRRFLRELKRRNVYKVAVTYAVVGFVVVQAADLLFPRLLLPAWSVRLVIGLVLVGFPIALVLAWAFEMTAEGMRRTPEEEEEAEAGSAYQWFSLALVLALAGGVWYVTAGGEERPAPDTTAGSDTVPGKSTPTERSIAVLPFDNLSGSEEAEPFVNGIHDDLLTRLSNISDLTVISRTSVLPYRETDLSLPAIADSLRVSWIVEGGVQQAGDQVQVNAQLIEAERDAHRWAKTYRRELTTENIFAIQSELTKKIARSLEAQLTPAEQERVERRPTENLDAYRLYVEGRRLLSLRSPQSIQEAQGHFEQALRRDSAYARAWAGLADARLLFAAYSSYGAADSVRRESGNFRDRMRAVLPGAREAAERALELAPDLAEAHTALGAAYFYEQLVKPDQENGPAALRAFRWAVELKPSYAHARQWLGDLYLEIGRPEKAAEQASLAVDLNPRHAAARQILGMAMLARGDTAGARKHLLREHPSEPPPVQKLHLFYGTGQWREVERLARRRLEADGVPLGRFALARTDLLRADTASARERLEELRRGPRGYGNTAAEGLILAALGRTDEAFEVWNRIRIWGRQSSTFRYYFSDVLDPLRDDPRYRELIREANRAWGLNPDGSLPDSVDVSFDAQSDE